MLNPDRNYYVYMMQSASRRALYIGVTSNLHQRVFNHKHHRTGGFTESYAAARLVYFEQYSDVRTAIDREKQLKGWRWEKKENLVAAMNPSRRDLSVGWYGTQGPSTPLRCARDDGSGNSE